MSLSPVELATDDGILLRGEMRSGGSDWVVLVHDLGSDLDCWAPLASQLTNSEVSLLAFDLRGHGGSDGEADPSSVSGDISAALSLATSQGASFTCVITSGASSLAALSAPAPLAQAYVLLSPTPGVQGADISSLRAPGAAKMILVGSLDSSAEGTARILSRCSIGPCTTVSFTTDEQGVSLLEGRWRDHAFERITRFVAEQRYLAAKKARRF